MWKNIFNYSIRLVCLSISFAPFAAFSQEFEEGEFFEPVDPPPVIVVPEEEQYLDRLEDHSDYIRDVSERMKIKLTTDPRGPETTPPPPSRIDTISSSLSNQRSSALRAAMVRKHGGNAESEKAVAVALRWLAEHQLPDGGWRFDHIASPRCQGQCRNSGTATKARWGATAMALLPFLGAGQTHMQGKYQSTVKSGLFFLVSQMKFDPARGGSWSEDEGRLYSHGLASIALCEAYMLTHDKGLHRPAQASIIFICYAQAVDGGWRYMPKQNGDMSVFGWQLMALKTGRITYLRVPPQVVKAASRFLDKVQANGGAQYGYTGPATGRHATTAIGLLCRMYLGWKKDNPALQNGADRLSNWGPSFDVYYNYFATQVMFHIGGDRWTKWNNVMRDRLVNSQAKEGHEAGSWYHTQATSHENDRGGRLYHTAMSALTLEVYYRYRQIYDEKPIEDEFPE